MKKVMLFGTFDGFHEGHKNFFAQARELNPESFLVVSVARDVNVKKIKNNFPELNEEERKKLIEDSGLADKVVLGGEEDYIAHIVEEKPDFIALGYDQEAYVENLKNDLEQAGLNVGIFRMKPYKEDIYKNRLINKKS